MTEPFDGVTERISTVEDGPDTVNERLTTGGPGPEGQPDTVHEILNGPPAVEAAPEPDAESEPAAPVES